MWLSRNTKVLYSFLPQKLEVYICSMYSVFGFTDNQPSQQAQMTSDDRRQKNYGLHLIAFAHNIAHVN